MQYRLSTLFLIFFVVAASLAAFGAGGIAVASLLFLIAVFLNRSKSVLDGVCNFIIYVLGVGFAILIFVVYPIQFLMYGRYGYSSRELVNRQICNKNLSQIGQALLNYEVKNRQLPPVFTTDQEGKPLQSWLVEILPYLEYEQLYHSLDRNEPWNSPHNAQVLCPVTEFLCPSVKDNTNTLQSNYLAVIGPGTIWKAEGTKKSAELTVTERSHLIVAVEVVNSDKHWAEPFALTVDELLENTRTGKGVRISSKHHGVVHMLFTDGTVRKMPSRMPLSLWREIFDGKVTDLDDLKSRIDVNAPDMVETSQYRDEPIVSGTFSPLSAIVWLVSVVWLFYRAVKSRKVIPQALVAGP